LCNDLLGLCTPNVAEIGKKLLLFQCTDIPSCYLTIENGTTMRIVKMIGNILVVGFIIGIGFAGWLYNKPHRDIGAEEADYNLSANELFEAFLREEEQANKKYLNKVVQVNGSVKETSIDQKGRVSLVLAAEEADMGGVNARFSEDQTEKAKKVGKDKQITIKCRCIGFESDLFKEVRLDNCSFVN
jgi:hypothetical protein